MGNQNKEKNLTILQIPIEELTFDIENPRIPKSVRREDELSVLEWMINKENVVDLMTSIGEKGFFPGEPLLVIKDAVLDKFITVEGNRRYTATFLLNYPEKAPVRKNTIAEIAQNAHVIPPKVPVVVFNARDEILDYLGYRHITGVEPWDALSKARYLSVLYNRLSSDMSPGEKYKALARQIGSKPSYVRQILIGGKLVDVIESRDYFNIRDLDDQTFEFGSFYTAIVMPNIAKYIGINIDEEDPLQGLCVENLHDLVSWMFEKNGENQTRLGESRNLTRLNKILDPRYSKALIAFKNGDPLTVAVELTDEADEIVKKKIKESLDAIQIAWSYFPSIKEYSMIDQEQVKEINNTAVALYKSLLAKLTAEKDLEEIQ